MLLAAGKMAEALRPLMPTFQSRSILCLGVLTEQGVGWSRTKAPQSYTRRAAEAGHARVRWALRLSEQCRARPRHPRRVIGFVVRPRPETRTLQLLAIYAPEGPATKLR